MFRRLGPHPFPTSFANCKVFELRLALRWVHSTLTFEEIGNSQLSIEYFDHRLVQYLVLWTEIVCTAIALQKDSQVIFPCKQGQCTYWERYARHYLYLWYCRLVESCFTISFGPLLQKDNRMVRRLQSISTFCLAVWWDRRFLFHWDGAGSRLTIVSGSTLAY